MASSSDQKEGAVIVDDELTELRKKRLAFLKQKCDILLFFKLINNIIKGRRKFTCN